MIITYQVKEKIKKYFSNDQKILCGKCHSTRLSSADEGEMRCDMCGWRKYGALGSPSKRPYKFQVKYIGVIRRDKRTPITIGIKESSGEPNRVMRYELYCSEVFPNCAELTEQGPRKKIYGEPRVEIIMTCKKDHKTMLVEASNSGELYGWKEGY